MLPVSLYLQSSFYYVPFNQLSLARQRCFSETQENRAKQKSIFEHFNFFHLFNKAVESVVSSLLNVLCFSDVLSRNTSQ